jgi:heme/copper-type cytochrome/quinol oxidase subunit 1|tara:strand:+ start:173 stop:463 length:291 start_codon:yes stop_codon:yes gene_type:complete
MRHDVSGRKNKTNYMLRMFRIIIIYELTFLFFWNLLYYSNSGIENWFQEKILTAVFVFLSTMLLGLTVVYIIYISAKLSGIVDKLKKIKDPRKSIS